MQIRQNSANSSTASCRKREILPEQKNVKAPSQFATHFWLFAKFRSVRKSTHDSTPRFERQARKCKFDKIWQARKCKFDKIRQTDFANSTKFDKTTVQIRQNSAKVAMSDILSLKNCHFFQKARAFATTRPVLPNTLKTTIKNLALNKRLTASLKTKTACHSRRPCQNKSHAKKYCWRDEKVILLCETCFASNLPPIRKFCPNRRR